MKILKINWKSFLNSALIDSDNVEKLIEEAINSIDRDSEIETVKNIIKESDKFLTKKIIEISEKNNQDRK